MRKFKAYRAVASITLILSLLIYVLSFWITFSGGQLLYIISLVVSILFFLSVAFLVSIFNFFNEPLWKKISVWFFIIGLIIPGLLFVFVSYAEINFFNFIYLFFYTPMAIAFLTIRNDEIKPFAHSFAYVLLITCLLRIALPFINQLPNFSAYLNLINIVYKMPLVFMTLMFHKMIKISAVELLEQENNGQDLL